MIVANSMEMVALTTAMADAYAKVQATLREMRKERPKVLSDRRGDTDPEDVHAAIETSENISDIIQTQLSYMLRKDSLITIPGTSADSCRICHLFCNSRLIFAEMKGNDYWKVGNSFETMKAEIENSATEFNWAGASYIMNGNLNTLTRAFASSLAALGVEASIATIVMVSDSVGLVMGNFDNQAVTNTSK